MPAEYPEEFKHTVILGYEKGVSIQNAKSRASYCTEHHFGANYTALFRLLNTRTLQRSIQTRYESALLHTLASMTIGYISVLF